MSLKELSERDNGRMGANSSQRMKWDYDGRPTSENLPATNNFLTLALGIKFDNMFYERIVGYQPKQFNEQLPLLEAGVVRNDFPIANDGRNGPHGPHIGYFDETESTSAANLSVDIDSSNVDDEDISYVLDIFKLRIQSAIHGTSTKLHELQTGLTEIEQMNRELQQKLHPFAHHRKNELKNLETNMAKINNILTSFTSKVDNMSCDHAKFENRLDQLSEKMKSVPNGFLLHRKIENVEEQMEKMNIVLGVMAKKVDAFDKIIQRKWTNQEEKLDRIVRGAIDRKFIDIHEQFDLNQKRNIQLCASISFGIAFLIYCIFVKKLFKQHA